MTAIVPLSVGQTLTGPLFNEPMRVETIAPADAGSWVVGLVGLQSERFRRVPLLDADLAALTILGSASSFAGEGNLLRLGIQAYSLGIAYEFDPYFGLSISRVDPLPHQLEAVYDYVLKLARVRFLLADDAGAGKIIMAGLLIRELKLRGVCERILIAAPANLAFQWQRELKEKFEILVATEAAGEGINLQCCNILFNYDIPWNPNRLEQRMGRIHRYGQRKDCLIFNFVATNTIEGRVLQRLLEKLQEIRNALNDDAVFNVVGEVLPAAQIERVLRDYYAGHLGDADLEDRLLHNVDEGRFRAICQNALEGLASKRLNLEMLIERRAKAQERRVIPETIARFLSEAAGFCVARPSSPCRRSRTPSIRAARRRSSKNYERNPDWRLPSLLAKYPRLSTHRETADENNLEWVTPGHPLFEAVRRHTFHLVAGGLQEGGVLLLARPRSAGPDRLLPRPRRRWPRARRSTNGCSPSRSATGGSRARASRPSWATSPPLSRPTRCPPWPTCRKRRPGCTSTGCSRSSTRCARNG